MSDNCFYKMLGEEFGPVSVDDLRELVNSGQLAGNDEVRLDKARPWQRVAQVAELGGTAATASMTRDRSTPQKTRGLFSSLRESVEGQADDFEISASALDEFHDLSELMIDSGDAPPVSSAVTTPIKSSPSKSAHPPREITPSSRFATPSGPALSPAARSAPSPRPTSPASAPPVSAPVAPPAAYAPPTPAFTPAPVSVAPPTVAPVSVAPVAIMPVAVPVAAVPVAPPPAVPQTAEDLQWYCWTNNQQYGPVALETLVKWAKAGRLKAKDHVKFGEEGEWFEAGSVEELFETPKKAGGAGQQEIKVQSREEFQQLKKDPVTTAGDEKKDESKPETKFQPLVSKELLKQAGRRPSDADAGLSKNAKLGLMLGVLALVGAGVYLPKSGLLGGGNRWEMGIYQKLRGHHAKLKEFRSKNDASGWEKYSKTAEPEINSLKASLAKSAGAKYPARQQLLYAVKDHWKTMVGDSVSKPGPGEAEFEKCLTAARKLLQKKR